MPLYRFDSFELDTAAHYLTRSGSPIHLEPKPYAILRHLVERWPDFVTQDELRAAGWPGAVVSGVSLQTAINHLRRAIGQAPGERYPVACLQGHGYRLKCDVRVAQAERPPSARPPGDVLTYRAYVCSAMRGGKSADEADVEAAQAMRNEHKRFGA